MEELEDDKTFNEALSTQNKRTDNVKNINNEVQSRHKEDEKRTSGNMVAGSDEAAFSMQKKRICQSRRPYKGFTLQERIEATLADPINNITL